MLRIKNSKSRQLAGFFYSFENFSPKSFGNSRKSSTFAPAIENCKDSLGYGVMVTLQILVLPFLVRVRVPQLTERGFQGGNLFSFQTKSKIILIDFAFRPNYSNFAAKYTYYIINGTNKTAR